MRPSLARRCHLLEVERKFRGLATPKLTLGGGDPPFRSLQALGTQKIHDVYYDTANMLSSAGLWVRQRNGLWEVKIRKGGDRTNSMFREMTGERDIAAAVGHVLGRQETELGSFGLQPIADMVTNRETWIADDDFHVVLDNMDFGHTVGEVELEQHLQLDEAKDKEEQEAKMLQTMDSRIHEFMKRYSWAFSQGIPTGKLTAYFEWKARSSRT